MVEKYFPPEAVHAFFRGLKLAILTFVASIGPALAASASDSHVTSLEWTLVLLGAAGAAAVALGARTAEGYGDARRNKETPQSELTDDESLVVAGLRNGTITMDDELRERLTQN